MAAVEKELTESKKLLIEAHERIHYQQQAHIQILENRILIEENLKQEIKQLREELKTERNLRQKNAENDREESFHPCSLIRENLIQEIKQPREELKTERNFRHDRKKNAESDRENDENDRENDENDREDNENDRVESFNPFSFIRENLMSWLSPSQQLHWDQGNLFVELKKE